MTSRVFLFAKNKILFEDEAAPAYPWLSRTGHPIDQPFGYTWIGFYETKMTSTKALSLMLIQASSNPAILNTKTLTTMA